MLRPHIWMETSRSRTMPHIGPYRHEDQVMKRWMLHDNISREGYGNALIGRYGGCFEERYREVYDDRAYHAKVLDVPAKVDANFRSEKREMHGTEEASKYEEVEV